MEQTWRWFGPEDKVTLSDARQAGATGIVTALHHVAEGEIWTVDAIRERQRMIEAAGLRWTVVESLNVSERIKVRGPGFVRDVDNYIESLRNLAVCGLCLVAYNLMPVFSWMRTELAMPLENGASAMRFDATAFAVFDLFMLKRAEAEADWPEDRRRAAHTLFSGMCEGERDRLQTTILQGLPGGSGVFTLDMLREALARYIGIDAVALRANVSDFLRVVCPVAQELGLRLGVHPDDPPKSLLGLPRIVSTADDLAFLLEQTPVEANGITFCTGSFGVRKNNNLIEMVERFGHRIWFAHLRSTQREADEESFCEAAHLEGDADLIGIVIALVREERRRRRQGDRIALPFRADHGQQLLNDRERDAQPGYPAIGRLRGLAELRGAIGAAERMMNEGERDHEFD